MFQRAIYVGEIRMQDGEGEVLFKNNAHVHARIWVQLSAELLGSKSTSLTLVHLLRKRESSLRSLSVPRTRGLEAQVLRLLANRCPFSSEPSGCIGTTCQECLRLCQN